MMHSRLCSPWTFVSGVLLAGVSVTWAQNPPHAVVVKAEKRAFAPALSQVVPLPPDPEGFDDDRMPLRRPGTANTVQNDPSQERSPSPLANLSTLSTNSSINILGIGIGFPNYPSPALASVPDTNGAVGATQFVQFVNDSFAIFDKATGSILSGPTTGNTLWQSLGAPCSTSPHLDEIAQYDKIGQRWVMMMPSTTSLCVAVSQSSDATGGWNLFSFRIPSSPGCGGGLCAADYPKLAVWPDAYYISYNENKTNSFVGDAVCALDRTNMLPVNPATKPTMQCFVDQNPVYGNMLPADLDGSTAPPTGSPEFFLNFDSDHQSLDVWQFHVDWTTPSNSTFSATPANIPVAAFTEPCGETGVQITYTTGNCIPQTGTTNTLDSYGDRLMYRVAYRNMGDHQSLLANHTVQPGGAGNPTGISWYELQAPASGSAFSLYQQGTYSPADGNYRWMGSIAMDQSGDIALGYSVSGSSMSPSIRYTGRLFSDSLGQMESEIDVLSPAGVTPASATQSFHWADYSSMSIDPTDDCTFWFTTEYIPTQSSSWSTRIASFSFPSCGTTPDFSVTPSPAAKTVSAGGAATFDLAVAGVGGFNSAVTLSCSTPTGKGLNCSLDSTSATPGNTVHLTVTTTAPSSAMAAPSGNLHPYTPGAWIGLSILGLMGVGSLGLRSQRRRLTCVLLSAVVLGSVALEVACGGSGNGGGGQNGGGTPTGDYMITINATSGSTQHSSTVTVTVQ